MHQIFKNHHIILAIGILLDVYNKSLVQSLQASTKYKHNITRHTGASSYVAVLLAAVVPAALALAGVSSVARYTTMTKITNAINPQTTEAMMQYRE